MTGSEREKQAPTASVDTLTGVRRDEWRQYSTYIRSRNPGRLTQDQQQLLNGRGELLVAEQIAHDKNVATLELVFRNQALPDRYQTWDECLSKSIDAIRAERREQQDQVNKGLLSAFGFGAVAGAGALFYLTKNDLSNVATHAAVTGIGAFFIGVVVASFACALFYDSEAKTAWSPTVELEDMQNYLSRQDPPEKNSEIELSPSPGNKSE